MRVYTELQYRVSLKAVADLRAARAYHEAHPHPNSLAQAFVVAGENEMIARIEAEIAEYEAVRSGTLREITVEGLATIPDALIKGRIAAGLTQRQLAERLGVPEASISRDEAGGYTRAGIDRLVRVADALGLRIVATCHFAPEAATQAAPAPLLVRDEVGVVDDADR